MHPLSSPAYGGGGWGFYNLNNAPVYGAEDETLHKSHGSHNHMWHRYTGLLPWHYMLAIA